MRSGISLYMNADQPMDGAEALLGECDWLRRLARSLVSDSARAEDAVQETLAAAIQNPPHGTAPSRSWLSRVLRNALAQESRGRVRREDREALVEPRGASPASDKIAERLELQRRVFESVNALEPIYRDVIVLRYFDALPPREIAKQLDRPVKTVHTRIERGLEMLRGKLDAEFGGERGAWFSALLPFATGTDLIPSQPLEPGGVVAPVMKLAILLACVIGLTVWLNRPSLEPHAGVSPASHEVQREQPASIPAELEEPARQELPIEKEPRVPLVSAEGAPRSSGHASISGRILDDKGIGRRVKVWAVPASKQELNSGKDRMLFSGNYEAREMAEVQSELDGRFQFASLAAGAWWVGVAPDSEWVNFAQLFELGQAAIEAQLDVSGGEVIVGEIVLSGLPGHSLAGREVRFNKYEHLGEASCVTDEAGHFVSPKLPPGVYAAGVFYGAQRPRWWHFVKAGELDEGELNIVYTEGPGPVVTGIVRDSSTGQPTQAKVTISHVSGSYSRGTNGEAGTFRFAGVRPDVYTLRAAGKNGEVAVLPNLDLRTGELLYEYELLLEPGTRFELSLEGVRDRCRVAVYSDAVLVDDFTLRKSAPNVLALPAGPVLFDAYVTIDGQRTSLSETVVEAVAGAHRELVITLDR